MTITGMLMLCLWLFLIPLGIGLIPAGHVDGKQKSISFMWITGYILMWALFQIICVPFILLEGDGDAYFPYVVYTFGGVCVVLTVIGIIWRVYVSASGKVTARKTLSTESNSCKQKWKALSIGDKAAWCFALLLIGVQMVLSVCMNYADGDDAFYVAVSSLTESSDSMYKAMPYSMGATGLSRRHSLAPFPIWIAFLARVSGTHTAIVAHTITSTILILLAYVIFYQIGKLLFKDRERYIPIFLTLTALLVIWGDYSIYSVENFMIARSRQGKAALGSIVIPMVILLFLMIFERVQLQQKVEWMIWLLLAATVTVACLCTTLGTFLACLLLGALGLCAGVVYRNWGLVWKTACCCMPAVVFAGLYFWLG